MDTSTPGSALTLPTFDLIILCRNAGTFRICYITGKIVKHPRGSSQMGMQVYPLGSLPAEIKYNGESHDITTVKIYRYHR